MLDILDSREHGTLLRKNYVTVDNFKRFITTIYNYFEQL